MSTLTPTQRAAGRVLVLKVQTIGTFVVAGCALLVSLCLLALQQRLLAGDAFIMTAVLLVGGAICRTMFQHAAVAFQRTHGETYSAALRSS